MKNFTAKVLAVFALFASLASLAQQRALLQKVEEKLSLNSEIPSTSPFTSNALKATAIGVPEAISDVAVLDFEMKALDQVIKDNPEVFEMELPHPAGVWKLELIPAEIHAASLEINSTTGSHSVDLGKYYRGVVKGHPSSLVSLVFFKGEVQAMIAVDGVNYTLGKLLDQKANGAYVVYNEGQIDTQFPNFCGTQETEEPIKMETSRGGLKDANNCVNVYFELDYDVFQNKGSVAGAANYISAVFNEVATLYANESINIKISEIFVWDSPSPYNSSSSSNMLNGFRSQRPNFNGDIAHLIDMNPSNGGIAYVDVVCNESYDYAYSGIYANYNNVPAYSWTVEVITHEIGHNLGSPHTHSCSWPGGAIDNCYTPEGACTPGPDPDNGGTIMSYCHLTSEGINFNNGFGPLPGDLIRDRVYNANCLSGCDLGTVCSVPSAISSSNETTSSFDVSWNNVSTALSYDVRYRQQGTSTWNNLSASSNSITISGLSPLTTYDVQVQSLCDGEVSGYSATQNFTTLSDQPTYCNSQGNDASYEWIGQVVVGSFTKNSGSAQYSDFTADVIALEQGETVSVSLTPEFSGSTYNEYWKIWVDLNQDGDFSDSGELLFEAGLSSSTVTGNLTIPAGALLGDTRLRVSMKYNGEQTACESFSYGEVEDYTLRVEEQVVLPCETPQNLATGASTTNSVAVSWSSASSNETGFSLQYRAQGTSSWSSKSVSGTSTTVSGLAHSTTYEFRVRANCDGESSSYSSVVTGATDTPAPCDAPSGLQASNITANSIDYSWSAVSEANDYVLQYREAGSATWSSISVGATSTSVSGLAGGTTYEARVRSNCEFESSAYSAIVSATTETAPITYCSASGNSGSEWISSVSLGSLSNSSGNNGGYADFTAQSFSVEAGDAFAVSLTPDFPSSWFWGKRTQQEHWRIYVDYNHDGDFNDAGELAFDAGTSTATVNGNVTVPANATSGETRVRVVMRRSSGGASCGSIGSGEVEDYTIDIQPNVPEPCVAPSGLASTGKTDVSISVSWSAVSPAQAYILEHRVSGGSWGSQSVTSTAATISGLQAATSYEIRVSSDCGSETSPVSGSITVTTEEEAPEPVNYCASAGNNSSDEWIDRISIGSFSNNSGNNGGYADFTAQSVSLQAGASYSILLEPGFTSGWFGMNTYPEYWKIWIDANKDGDFNDAGELVFDAGGTSSSDVSGTLNVPANAMAGATRMRVSMKYNAAQGPCETFAYGEVEDYTVMITAGFESNSPAVATFANWSVTISPNPGTFVGNLQVTGVAEDAALSYQVLDMSGKQVLRGSFSGTQSQIQAADLKPGSYIVTVSNQQGDQQMVRWIKQ